MYYNQGCSPKILTSGALYKRSWALPKRKCIILGSSIKTQFPAYISFKVLGHESAISTELTSQNSILNAGKITSIGLTFKNGTDPGLRG